MVKVNPYWNVSVTGELPDDPRRPYVIVSNHQSSADIPFLSHLPWEMKWMAKTELFSIPFTGWMLRLAGDIRIDRNRPRSAVAAMRRAAWYLQRKCSIMVFPEGTRSPDGKVYPFMSGAFQLAVDAGVPILPVAIDGSFECLPKQTWRFSPVDDIRIRVFPAIDTSNLDKSSVGEIAQQVRDVIVDQIASWRNVPRPDVDAA